MRRVEGDCHDLYLGESHGFRGSSQLRPWGAGILNKPKNRSCHLPPTANFTFTPIFHQKSLLKFLPDLLWNRIFSLSFALELNFKRGDIWVWSETIFLHGALLHCHLGASLFAPQHSLYQLIGLIFADHIFNWSSLHWDLDSSHGWQPACGLLSRSATTKDDFCWEFSFPF